MEQLKDPENLRRYGEALVKNERSLNRTEPIIEIKEEDDKISELRSSANPLTPGSGIGLHFHVKNDSSGGNMKSQHTRISTAQDTLATMSKTFLSSHHRTKSGGGLRSSMKASQRYAGA